MKPIELTVETCKCGTKIMMVEHHKTGRRAPIEVQPSSDGNILIRAHLYQVIPKQLRAQLQASGFELRKNHFATCPFANDFR